MQKFNLFSVSQSDRKDFCENIIASSAPRYDFYFMVILSTIIVSFGIIKDNIVLVIGGMLVTPLLSPILAISLGLVIRNLRVLLRSVKIFIIALLLAILVSYLTSLLIDFNVNSVELLSLMEASWHTLILAIVAGIAASFAWIKPNLNNTLPGIAITVTLIPPLTAIGLAAGVSDFVLMQKVFNVLALNVLGIIIGSLIIFMLMSFYKAKRKLIAEIKEEERKLS